MERFYVWFKRWQVSVVSDYGFESCGIYDGDELIVHKHHLTHIDKNFGDGLELCSVKVNNILGVIG